jgi:hypothetical protein
MQVRCRSNWIYYELIFVIEKKGVQLTSLRFLLDGVRIKDQDTPKMLELDDGDSIVAVIEMSGGDDI